MNRGLYILIFSFVLVSFISIASIAYADVQIDQILLKGLVKVNEKFERSINLINTGDSIRLTPSLTDSLAKIANISENEFILPERGTKDLVFSTTPSTTGVFVGKMLLSGDGVAKELPIVIEVETKKVGVDGSVDMRPRSVEIGTDAIFFIDLFNLAGGETKSVGMDYSIRNFEGRTIFSESETVAVTSEARYSKTVSIPKNLKPDSYVFAVVANADGLVGTSSIIFSVTSLTQAVNVNILETCIASPFCVLGTFALIIVILPFSIITLFMLRIFSYVLPQKRERKPKPAIEKPILPKPLQIEVPVLPTIKPRLETWSDTLSHIYLKFVKRPARKTAHFLFRASSQTSAFFAKTFSHAMPVLKKSASAGAVFLAGGAAMLSKSLSKSISQSSLFFSKLSKHASGTVKSFSTGAAKSVSGASSEIKRFSKNLTSSFSKTISHLMPEKKIGKQKPVLEEPSEVKTVFPKQALAIPEVKLPKLKLEKMFSSFFKSVISAVNSVSKSVYAGFSNIAKVVYSSVKSASSFFKSFSLKPIIQFAVAYKIAIITTAEIVWIELEKKISKLTARPTPPSEITIAPVPLKKKEKFVEEMPVVEEEPIKIDVVSQAIKSISKFISKSVGTVSKFFGSFFKSVSRTAVAVSKAPKPAFNYISRSTFAIGKTGAQFLGSFSKTVSKSAASVSDGLIDSVSALSGLLYGAVDFISKSAKSVFKNISKFVSGFKPKMAAVLISISAALGAFALAVSKGFKKIAQSANSMLKPRAAEKKQKIKIPKISTTAVSRKMGSVSKSISKSTGAFAQSFSSGLGSISKSVVAGIKTAMQAAKSFASSVKEKIASKKEIEQILEQEINLPREIIIKTKKKRRGK